MRGEQLKTIIAHIMILGSPPHARGTAVLTSVKTAFAGITPACAGNRDRESVERDFNEDHPRMRGEQSSWQALHTYSRGSPPHARGTAGFYHDRLRLDGITPACAGNRDFIRLARAEFGDHPRMRGEQGYVETLSKNPKGSPPHARGTVDVPGKRWVFEGITPACAGNSKIAKCAGSCEEDHPRMRGEQYRQVRNLNAQCGSPPHARGTGFSNSVYCYFYRITPACAGNSQRRCPQGDDGSDHPRMRGEQEL